jgi:hypothetical protein
VFLINSSQSLFSAPSLRRVGPPYCELTGLSCLVPSRPFSRAPEAIRLAHLCQFWYGSSRLSTNRFSRNSLQPGIGHTAWTSDSPADLRDSSRSFRPHAKELRNIDLLSIDYAFRPCLRSRLTLGGFTFPRKPWAYGDGILTRFIVTQAGIFTSCRSTHPCRKASTPTGTLLLPLLTQPAASASPLIPDNYRRQIPRPVSCYALFKWWLLLSQHPGCHGNLTSFRTKLRFRGLSWRSGLFLLLTADIVTPGLSPGLAQTLVFGVWLGRVGLWPHPHPVALPPSVAFVRLTLKLFRGERAISWFD